MNSSIKISLPIIETFKVYKKTWIKKDLLAGITVAAVAIPQAMAYSQLAGLPLTAGLYAALIAMLIFAVFTTSRFSIVGPDAAMAALTGAAIIPLANSSPEQLTSLAAVLAVIIGAVCVFAVFARLGIIAEFISRPILLGYMAGLALAVIASQAPKLFGLVLPSTENFLGTVLYIFRNIASISLPTFIFSLILLAFVVILQKFSTKTPVSLVILVGSVIASALLSLSDKGIAVIGDVPTGLPIPFLPEISLSQVQNLVVPALMISLVSYANTIATARAFAKDQKQTIEAPQEFFGLGIANIGSGIFGGMPVAASGARTAVNHTSNAKTQVSQIFGGLAIAVTLLFLAPLLKDLPMASLAVIVILAVKPLFNYNELKSIWHAWHSEALLAIVTLVGVTVLGIFQGLILAILLAIMNLVRKTTLPSYAVLGLAEDGSVRDMSRPPKTQDIPGMIIFRFDAPLYFSNANYFKDTVCELIEKSNEKVLWFLWDAETVTEVDSTAGQMLLVLIRDLKSQGITFAIARMKGPIRQRINKSHRLARAVAATPHFSSMGEAIAAFEDSKAGKKSK